MKKILIPIDFSEHSMKVISYGQKLFEKEEVVFYLFAAFQVNVPSTIEDAWGNEWVDTFESENMDIELHIPEQDLQELVRIAKQGNLIKKHQFKVVSTVNTLDEGIAEQAKALGIDLILMSTKGAKGLKQFFLGSNAVNVINKVLDCPIMIVPRSYTTLKCPKQVVFSTNFKRPFNVKEIQPLLDLLQQWNAELKIVQLMEESNLDDKQKLYRDALVHLLGEVPHVFQKIVYETSETNAIRDFVAETQSEMIALIHHKHSFFYGLLQENVVEKTAFNSPVPLLVLRGLV